jgi:ketosteroid isomerase-like protein
MKAIPAIAALIAATPLAAQPTSDQIDAAIAAAEVAGSSTPEDAVKAAADAFFAALRGDDKTALAAQMLTEGVIFVHNRMNPKARVDVVPVAKHLENWAKSPPGLDEVMAYDTVLIDGDMAQVWGPYRFTAGGKTTHCGINALSLVLTDSGWKVANTSFTMERPEFCDELGAPEAPAQ